jgi:Ca2+-binding RTX toxin-like protein
VNVTRSANANANATLEPWAIINMDEVGGTIDLSSFFSSASNLASPDGIVPAVEWWKATLQGLATADTFTGTSGIDVLTGRDGADILRGGGGNDTVNGGAGNDTIQYTVGDGIDTINGGADTDTLAVSGTAGNDTIHVVVNGSSVTSIEGTSPTNVENYTVSGLGNTAAGDTLDFTGTTSAVTVNLGTGSATGFMSVTGIENVTGGSDNDSLTGNSDPNTLSGGAGADHLSGGGGNDAFRYVLGDGDDVIDGGTGSDTLDYTGTASVVTVDLGTNTATGLTDSGGSFTSIENVTGGSDADTLIGDSGANVLTGGGDDDTLDGGGGTDTAAYAGTLAQSALTAVAGHWEVNGGAEGTDTLENIEIVQHGGGRYLLVGNGGFADAATAATAATQAGDTIVFAAPPPPDNPIVIDLTDTNEDIDVTIPYDVDVDIETGGGDNHITTGDGDNHITTGGGDNEIVTGDGNSDIVTGDGDNEVVTGNGNNDIVTGDGNNDIVTGDGNNDIVAGDGDNDIVTGGGDNEIVTGDGNNDIVTGNGNNDIVTGAGEDHVTTGGGGDTVKTGGGNDVVDSGGGEDTIIGGSGNGDDVYNAGLGSDTVVYSSATNAITVDLTQIDRFNQPASGGGTIGDLLTAALLDPHTPVGKGQGVDIGTDALIDIENVTGGAGNDSITGDSDANILTGAGGNDTLNGGANDDTLDGGAGIDTAVFSGPRSAYAVTRSGNTLTVSGPDGLDTLTHIEKLAFDDRTVPSGLAPVHSDFGGDSTSDLLWRHDSGQVYFWEMNNLQSNAEGSVTHAEVPNDWQIEGSGDFNGDGNSDILWRQDDSGQVYVWEMNGLQIQGEGAVTHAAVTNDWHVQGTGDFNGDGNSDVLWRQDGTGQMYIWEMNGQQVQAEGAVAHAAVPNDWQVQGVGDFNGDGSSDVLWRQDGSGQVYVWEMNGQQVQAEGAVAHAAVPNDWHIEGVGDFNGDGNSDVLWRQDGSGQVYVWEMNGQQVQAEGAVAHAPVASDWHVQSVGDFNGDGNSDVLWRQDGSGQVYVWQMNGSQVTAEGAVAHAPVPNDWHVLA